MSVVRSGCSTASWTGTATTTTNGAWSVTDPDAPSGTCRYPASYVSTGGYASSTATASTVVSMRATSLTATTPASLDIGAPLTVRGVLSAGTAALAGAPVGTCTYRASYAGDSLHAAATASATTTVSLRTTALTVT